MKPKLYWKPQELILQLTNREANRDWALGELCSEQSSPTYSVSSFPKTIAGLHGFVSDIYKQLMP